MEENSPVIQLENISFGYPGSSLILDKLDFHLDHGKKIGLIGPNGGGKTTFFHIIMGLLEPSSGTIEIFGKPIKNKADFLFVRQKIGLLFQNSDDQLFSPTVLEDVAFGPLNLGKTKKEAISTAMNTLKYLGLSGFEDRMTYKLSGGEKRLVSLATVLAMEPEILLLDEPTTGLDDTTKKHFIHLLSQLELSYILISHELDFLEETTDTICMIENGKMYSNGNVHLHKHLHAHPHGLHPHRHKS
jgi:cobalt/nickel transport system ATP-binding protein